MSARLSSLLAWRPRPTLAVAALLACAAAQAAPVVYSYTGVTSDGATVSGTFGWSDTATPSAGSGTHIAYYYDTPATPTGGFMTAQISGGMYDGASASVSNLSWQVIDGDLSDPQRAGHDGLIVVSSMSWIWLDDMTATAIDMPTVALPTQLNLADWADEHRGRIDLGGSDQVDFHLTALSRVSSDAQDLPEPTSLSLLAAAGLAWRGARRRRSAAAPLQAA